MGSYKTEAIILSQTNFGEADKILTVFSKFSGKIRILAKGARKINSRKGGNLELFNQVFLVLAEGKNLDIITEVELIHSFKDWRKNLIRVGVAYYLVELVLRLTAEGQRNDRVFFLLKAHFTKLYRSDLVKLIRNFEEELLTELGFGIPKELVNGEGSLSVYIEEIIERKLKSKEVLKRIKYG